ncbi:hypothetical protein [Roseomonas mucosa]
MPGQRGTEKRRVDGGQVLVRLAPGTAGALTRAADGAGLTEAAWVRRQLVDLLGADPADAVPVRGRRAPRPAPTIEILELARLREAVGEAVGTLRQVAGLDRARGGARLSEIDGALDRLIAAATELDATKRRLLQDQESEG